MKKLISIILAVVLISLPVPVFAKNINKLSVSQIKSAMKEGASGKFSDYDIKPQSNSTHFIFSPRSGGCEVTLFTPYWWIMMHSFNVDPACGEKFDLNDAKKLYGKWDKSTIYFNISLSGEEPESFINTSVAIFQNGKFIAPTEDYSGKDIQYSDSVKLYVSSADSLFPVSKIDVEKPFLLYIFNGTLDNKAIFWVNLNKYK